jgi:apolipoprotein D and lipocalin family protein
MCPCVPRLRRNIDRDQRRLLATIAAVLAVSAQSLGPVRTVETVDLSRYVGVWFEIARFPNRFQRRCVGDVRATYVRRSDGRIDVINRCRTR